MAQLKRVRTATLEIAYEESGPQDGTPIILMHGFPYDPRAYDGMTAPLAAAGHRVIVPYMRGYGPTRFLSPQTLRSGQQGAFGQDLLDLMDALGIARARLAGYDWGGRGACVVAALWPERVSGLVSIGGYNIQNIPRSNIPAAADKEHRHWYQYYFHTPRGEAGLTTNRRDICRKLWQLWSPNWRFDDETFLRSAESFDNDDFVAVVIHSYRHRYAYVAGDPAYDAIEARLAEQPAITVPTIVLEGGGDGVAGPDSTLHDAEKFPGPYQRRVVPLVGHNMPQEAPIVVVEALLNLPS